MVFEVIIGRSKKDVQRYGKQGTVFVAKQYVQMGQTTSLSNPVYMDIASAHVVFIVGKRGCFAPDTKIFTNHGYKAIKDFDPHNDKIYSFNGSTFEWENAKLLEYELDDENLIEIENYDGQKLVMTAEHPLLVLENNEPIWKKAENLKVNDLLLSVSQLPEVKNDKESFRIARLLGFILADGTMQARKGRFKDGRGAWYNGTKSRVRIISGSEDILRTAKKDLEEEFNLYVKQYKKGKENCFVVQSLHASVLQRFAKLGVPLGFKADIIRVPPIVLESSNAFKANFIKALFSCDGYVNKNGHHIVYYSKSRKFLEDLNLILAHFQVQSTIRNKIVKLNGKVFHNFQLNITDHTSLSNYDQKIGFVHSQKSEKLAKHTFWQSKRRKKTIYLNENIYGSKIKNITIAKRINEVYDLQVPKNNSFIANGVISHNSGKSYSMGAIAEGLIELPSEIKQNLAILVLDTMGIYWTMKYPNFKDTQILESWGFQSKPLDVKIYTPSGFFAKYKEEGIPADFPFSLRPIDIDPIDWCNTFALGPNSAEGILLTKVSQQLREGASYSLPEFQEAIKKDGESEQLAKNIVLNQLEKANQWGIFSKQGTPLKDIISAGQVSILDLSPYATISSGWDIKALVVGIIARTLFRERMIARKAEEFKSVDSAMHYFSRESQEQMKQPLVWMALDESHELLPREGKTAATDPLITILREGRQPGISLILASQQPAKIHTDVMTQSDIVLAHRLTAKMDIDALGQLMQSYMRTGLDAELDQLPKVSGAALIFDDVNERLFPVQMRPRFTWHGGGSPTAIQEKKDYFSDALKKIKEM